MGDKAVTFVNGRMKKAGDTGTVDFDGNVNLGNADTDSVVFNADVDSNIIPDDDNTFDLGSGSKKWAAIHAVNVNASGAILDKYSSEVVGGVYQLDDGLIQNPNSGYSRVYFPADDTLGETVAPSSVNYKIAPFDGELIKIMIKSSTSFSGKTLTVGLHKGSGTNNAYSSTYSASVQVNGDVANTAYEFDFTNETGTSISAGDIFGFSLQLSENWAGTENIHIASVVKFDPYAI